MSNRVSPEPGFELAQRDSDTGGQQQQHKRRQQEEEDAWGPTAQEQQQQQQQDDAARKKQYYRQKEEVKDDADDDDDDDDDDAEEDEEVRRSKKTAKRDYLKVVKEGERASPELGPDPAITHASASPAEHAAHPARVHQGRLPPVPADQAPTFAAEQPNSRIATVNMSSERAYAGSGKPRDEVIGSNNNPQDNGCCAVILTILSYILVVIFLPLSLCATIKVVQEYERAVIFRLGRLVPGGAKGPGIFFVMPCIEEYSKVDLRTVSFDVPPQEVLTRDSVTVSVDAVVYYRISNPTVSVANVENAANSTQLLAQTTLRNVLGTQNLAEILSNREHISEQMQNVLDDATDKWGIKVERVEIKDVRLPTQLQRAMAAEAEAARDARAKVIAAEGEQKASLALKEAADIIATSPAALQLRYLQTLNSISAEKNSTIIFPLPIELVSSLLKK